MAKKKVLTLDNITMKDLPAVIDQLQEVRLQLKDLRAAVKEVEPKESELRKLIYDALIKFDVKGMKGKIGKAELKEKERFTVTDSTKLHSYIYKKDAWDLLQKTLVSSAIVDRIEAGEKVPGVDSERFFTLSVGKA